ncbi:MAG: hypothetical protein J6X45_06640 [Lachnospiraceae bacterium]|nr:hypothetical protein [Lachnospiraceae bacterium]
MRLIDADELKKKLKLWAFNNVTTTSPTFDFVTEFDIDECPTVDVLEQIRDEIERLHYHPKLDFIKNDEVVDMALDFIDKYKGYKE